MLLRYYHGFHITICIYLFKFRFDDEHFAFINNSRNLLKR